MQSKVKKDTVKAMQKVMNNSTFYPDSQQYDLVAMEVQGKPNVEKCKEDYDVFVVVHREVRIFIFWPSGSLLMLRPVCMDAREGIQNVFVRYTALELPLYLSFLTNIVNTTCCQVGMIFNHMQAL